MFITWRGEGVVYAVHSGGLEEPISLLGISAQKRQSAQEVTRPLDFWQDE